MSDTDDEKTTDRRSFEGYLTAQTFGSAGSKLGDGRQILVLHCCGQGFEAVGGFTDVEKYRHFLANLQKHAELIWPEEFSDELRTAAERAAAQKRPGPPSDDETRRLAEDIVEGAGGER